MGVVRSLPRTAFIAPSASAKPEVIPLGGREALVREGPAMLVALPLHQSRKDRNRLHWPDLRPPGAYTRFPQTRPRQARLGKQAVPSLGSWPCCYPLSLCTRSSSAPNRSGYCGHGSLRTRRRTSRRGRPRCGLNHCGSSGGSSYDKARLCISSRCSNSASSRHVNSFARRSCPGCSSSCFCVGTTTSCCRLGRRGHRSPGNPHSKRCASSTRSKATEASTRLPLLILPTRAGPLAARAIPLRPRARKATMVRTSAVAPSAGRALLRARAPRLERPAVVAAITLATPWVSVKLATGASATVRLSAPDGAPSPPRAAVLLLTGTRVACGAALPLA